MDAIILAGGFAKRMWPLTKNKPKQLLDIAGRPMLDYVIDSLSNLDLDRIIVSVNSFFAPQFQNYLDSNVNANNIELFIEESDNEDQKLGALGALNLLFEKKDLRGPVFIAGGDNLSDFDLREMEILKSLSDPPFSIYFLDTFSIPAGYLKSTVKARSTHLPHTLSIP